MNAKIYQQLTKRQKELLVGAVTRFSARAQSSKYQGITTATLAFVEEMVLLSSLYSTEQIIYPEKEILFDKMREAIWNNMKGKK